MVVYSRIINKRTVPLGENSTKRNYVIDGKYGMVNFNNTELHRFHSWEKRTCTRELVLNLIQTSKNDISSKTHRSTESKEIIKL